MSTTTVKGLQDRRLTVWEQAKGIADRTSEENRNMSGEEERQWNELTAELGKLDGRIQDILNGEKRAKEAEDSMAYIAGKPVDPSATAPGAAQFTAEQEATELRKFVMGETRSYELRLPTAMERRAWSQPEYRVLQDVGGTTVPLPTSFVGQLYRYLVDTSSIRQTNPTIYSTTSGENLVVPRSTSEGVATWTGEGAALTASDPTISTVTLSAYKVAKLIQISSELLADTGFDIVGYMAEHAGRNLGIAVDTAYVAGTGTTQPTGLIQAPGSGGVTVAVQAAVATGSLVGLPTAVSGSIGVGADILIQLYHSIIPQYRPRASWVMNDTMIMVVRKLKDSTGQYIWQPALVAGQPDTILGRPVYADPHMPALGTVSADLILFGDFGGYFIRDVTPIRFERSDDFAFGNDLVSFRAIYRTDGKLGDTQSIKAYASAAS
jgi:HK97 family phage major capsid protein